ncbi:MAG: M23 family metallopeptidase, partial [Acidobacteriota bacterium]
NFVIIDHGNGEYSLLGHMMNGSIQVKEGDEVKAGDIIGKCGNSGNTFIPHIHYQLMDGANPVKYEVNGLPALFSNYSVFKPPTDFSNDFIPEDIVFKMEQLTNGDPELGQILEAQ